MQFSAIGRVGSDAQVKKVGERHVINFSIAVNKKKVNTNTGEMTEETQWLNCALWRNDAGSIGNYLKRGTQVFVQGEPSWDIYKKKDNRPGIDTRLSVQRIELLGSKKEESAPQTTAANSDNWVWDEDDSAAASDTPTPSAAEDAMPWDNEPDPAPPAKTTTKADKK